MESMARLALALAATLVCSACLKKDPLYCDESTPCRPGTAVLRP